MSERNDHAAELADAMGDLFHARLHQAADYIQAGDFVTVKGIIDNLGTGLALFAAATDALAAAQIRDTAAALGVDPDSLANVIDALTERIEQGEG